MHDVIPYSIAFFHQYTCLFVIAVNFSNLPSAAMLFDIVMLTNACRLAIADEWCPRRFCHARVPVAAQLCRSKTSELKLRRRCRERRRDCEVGECHLGHLGHLGVT
jgi:hypothetical protein